MCCKWSQNGINVLYLELKSPYCVIFGDMELQKSHIDSNFGMTKIALFAKIGIALVYILWYFINIRRITTISIGNF